jgi:hypothetical protein
MNSRILKGFFIVVLFSAIFFISGCASSVHDENGYLEGTISIGPICPVETIPPDPACLPTAETYKAYQVSVYSVDGLTKVAQLNPSLDGSYSAELPCGNYRVALEKAQTNVGGSNLPVEVSITQQRNTLLDVNIDTGIR